MRHLLLAALLCVFTAAVAAAAATTAPASRPATRESDGVPTDVYPRPQIHRMGAGHPDADGWCVARSTGAGYAVSLPGKFNDITVSERQADGSMIRTHMVAIAAPLRYRALGGARFAASAITNDGVKLPVDAEVTYVDILAGQGEVRSRRSVKVDGIDGTEIEIVKSKTVARFRVVQHDNVIYSMTVEMLGGKVFPGEHDAAARKFFESFRFRAPDASEDVPVKSAASSSAATDGQES